MTTFADVLAQRLRADPGQPLVTYYALATGERVELSVTTYGNWVAKAASLLAEEHDLERGQSLRVDLPTHWLGPVFLGAAWAMGLTVTAEGVETAEQTHFLTAVGCNGLQGYFFSRALGEDEVAQLLLAQLRVADVA